MKRARQPKRIRVVDRGTWAVLRIPTTLLTATQRDQVTKYIRDLPYSDRRYAGPIEAWCIKSVWLEPLIEVLEDLVGTKVLVEG